MSNIRRAAVIGSGTMGASIAAHLASAGIPTLLLDIPSPDGPRSGIAQKGLERVLKSRPPAFLRPEAAKLITVGNTEDDLEKLKDVDWVIEAIVENLKIKQELLQKLEKVVGPQTIVSSNSSGIPMKLQASVLGDDLKKRFLGTHFFNPPRYLHLLELIPTRHTDPEVVQRLAHLGEVRLGKGIVIAKDVPGFAANRVGVYCMGKAMQATIDMGLTQDLVDVLTGPILGRPKSATFRTGDVVGLDVTGMVAEGLQQATGEDFTLPQVVKDMIARKWLGDKTGQGFYKKDKSGGATKILSLNFETMEYEERPKAKLAELGPILALPTPQERTKALLELDGVAGDFTRKSLLPQLAYAASKIGEVAESAEEVDNSLRWGFGWTVGPIELARYLGQDFLKKAFERAGLEWAPALEKIPAEPKQPSAYSISYQRQVGNRPVMTSPVASLWDMGDGVSLLEFHSKANAIGVEVLEFMDQAHERVCKDFNALVIGNEGENFCAGADLNMLLGAAMQVAEGKIDALRQQVKIFQAMTTRLRYAPYPVVAALHGLNLGGGCEVGLWSDACVASAELYTGLVEVGVGILPAGGGTTEMLFRMMDRVLPGADPFPAVRAAFEMIAMAKVSGSAFEAQQMGILRPTDHIVMNADLRLSEAKRIAASLAPGYQAPARRRVQVMGELGLANLKAGAIAMHEGGLITEYEIHLATTVATVLCGGTMNYSDTVDEQVILDLELEAFLQLCGQEKSRERLAHMLKTGKNLRN
ncbi:MAG: enoyl-CoA hydratase/isomerase family protein [Candidatus Eremiobacteraeota bacterium]|nr:enoyl-CoA hydratase/isomerase family protein [Candidatus Eremiobacteraeota bacterium]MCW5872340.1 enoyl-CoA hydratase/isomerase family protein [Candidatus Eremiobacteraeota bacterium]